MADADTLTNGASFALRSFFYRWHRLADEVFKVHPEFAGWVSDRGALFEKQAWTAMDVTTVEQLAELCAFLNYHDFFLDDSDVEENWLSLVEAMAEIAHGITLICDATRE